MQGELLPYAAGLTEAVTTSLFVILMVFIKMVYLQDIPGDPEVDLQAEDS